LAKDDIDRPVRPARAGSATSTEDTAVRQLTPEDRARLSMDAWEPSLLRKLLQAQGKLSTKDTAAE
jgi:hypothetical protein